MEDSILTSVKKALGLAEDYVAFDEDVLIHINNAFSTLTDLGVGPVDGFEVEDADTLWSHYTVSLDQLSMVKTYIYLKVKILFDPPSTSFHVSAAQNQINEFEWRLNNKREVVRAMNLPDPIIPVFDDVVTEP